MAIGPVNVSNFSFLIFELFSVSQLLTFLKCAQVIVTKTLWYYFVLEFIFTVAHFQNFHFRLLQQRLSPSFSVFLFLEWHKVVICSDQGCFRFLIDLFQRIGCIWPLNKFFFSFKLILYKVCCWSKKKKPFKLGQFLIYVKYFS